MSQHFIIISIDCQDKVGVKTKRTVCDICDVCQPSAHLCAIRGSGSSGMIWEMICTCHFLNFKNPHFKMFKEIFLFGWKRYGQHFKNFFSLCSVEETHKYWVFLVASKTNVTSLIVWEEDCVQEPHPPHHPSSSLFAPLNYICNRLSF